MNSGVLAVMLARTMAADGWEAPPETAGPRATLRAEGWTLSGVVTVTSRSACWADCDGSGSLSPADFSCFLQRYAAQDSRAECGGRVEVLDIDDFFCFMYRYTAGCP